MPRLLEAFAHYKHISPSDSSSHQDYGAPMQDPNRLRSRLHALFHSKDDHPENDATQASQQQPVIQVTGSEEGSGDCHGISRSISFPLSNGTEVGGTAIVVPPKPQREAIKVLIVTWNMGDALVRS